MFIVSKGLRWNKYRFRWRAYLRRGPLLPPPPPDGAGEEELRTGGAEKPGWLLRGAGALFTAGRLFCITGGVAGLGCAEGRGCAAGGGVGAGRVAGVGREVGLPPGCVCTGVLLLRGALGEVPGAGRPVVLPGV